MKSADSTPIIGKRYVFNPDDPFMKRHHVVVLDLSEGYVQYRFEHGSPVSWPVETFNMVYRPVEPEVCDTDDKRNDVKITRTTATPRLTWLAYLLLFMLGFAIGYTFLHRYV